MIKVLSAFEKIEKELKKSINYLISKWMKVIVTETGAERGLL